jgi:hypothetical protein
MTLWDARLKAEAEYKQALLELEAKPTQRNADRVKIKLALLDGLKRNYYRRTG